MLGIQDNTQQWREIMVEIQENTQQRREKDPNNNNN